MASRSHRSKAAAVWSVPGTWTRLPRADLPWPSERRPRFRLCQQRLGQRWTREQQRWACCQCSRLPARWEADHLRGNHPHAFTGASPGTIAGMAASTCAPTTSRTGFRTYLCTIPHISSGPTVTNAYLTYPCTTSSSSATGTTARTAVAYVCTAPSTSANANKARAVFTYPCTTLGRTSLSYSSFIARVSTTTYASAAARNTALTPASRGKEAPGSLVIVLTAKPSYASGATYNPAATPVHHDRRCADAADATAHMRLRRPLMIDSLNAPF